MLLVFTSIAAFASTNIDDIFILMLFFGDRKYRTQEVVVGQYLGFAALVFLSLLGSLAGLVIDTKYIGLLGFVPIYLGLKGLVKLLKKENKTEMQTTSRFNSPIMSIALVTFANGGDNIGIYIPLFASISGMERFWMIMIFFMMVAIWCWAARYLSKHPYTAKSIDRYGHMATPIILVLLGVYILYETNCIELLQ